MTTLREGVPDPEIPTPMDMPASPAELHTVFYTVTEFMKRYGTKTDEIAGHQERDQQQAKEALTYLADPEGTETLLRATDEEDKLDALREEEESPDLAEWIGDRGSKETYLRDTAANDDRSEEYELTIDDPELLRIAGYGEDVRFVDIFFEDGTRNPADLTARRCEVGIGKVPKPPVEAIDYSLVFEHDRGHHMADGRDKYSFRRTYKTTPPSHPEVLDMPGEFTDQIRGYNEFAQATGVRDIRAGEVNNLNELLRLYAESK